MKIFRIVGLIVFAWLMLGVLVTGVVLFAWVDNLVGVVWEADPSVLHTVGSIAAPLFIAYGAMALILLLFQFWLVFAGALDNNTDTQEESEASEEKTTLENLGIIRISIADIQNELAQQGVSPGEAAVQAEAAYPKRIAELLDEGWEILMGGSDAAVYLRRQ